MDGTFCDIGVYLNGGNIDLPVRRILVFHRMLIFCCIKVASLGKGAHNKGTVEALVPQ